MATSVAIGTADMPRARSRQAITLAINRQPPGRIVPSCRRGVEHTSEECRAALVAARHDSIDKLQDCFDNAPHGERSR